jgi:hypothetical protein
MSHLESLIKMPAIGNQRRAHAPMNSLARWGDPPGSEASFPGSRSLALAVTFTLFRTYIHVPFEQEYRVVCESAGLASSELYLPCWPLLTKSLRG